MLLFPVNITVKRIWFFSPMHDSNVLCVEDQGAILSKRTFVYRTVQKYFPDLFIIL